MFLSKRQTDEDDENTAASGTTQVYFGGEGWGVGERDGDEG